MRMTDIFQMAQRYFMLGIAAAVLVVVIFCIGYYVIYKKILHGTQKLPLKQAAFAAVLLCYVVVVLGATMLDRGGVWRSRRIDVRPFIAYRMAWNDFSIKEWRNIILNIGMFVPLGILLPLGWDFWKKAYRTYLAGLVFTVIIELAQLVTGRGIFELDDIFNNLLGTMIGYGIYRLLYWIYSMVVSEREQVLPVLLFQLPLLFTAVLFGTIFTVYRLQEFGNLSLRYVSRVDMSGVDVQLLTELSKEAGEASVYQVHTADEAETRRMAQELFEKLGTQLDEGENDIYDETAVYYSRGREYCVWIDYAGCSMQFYNFLDSHQGDGNEADGQPGCSRLELEEALAAYGVQIPAGASFQDKKDGEYLFELNEMDENLCKGKVTCTYLGQGKIGRFYNSMAVYQKIRDCSILSEQEAYEQLQAGKFRGENYSYDGDITSIVIDAVQLTYVTDTKGYDQPVYAFHGTVNGAEAEIQIPALSE